MRISLKRITARPPEGTLDVNLPIDMIGVLHQMRSSMSQIGLDDLAKSIKEVGQHTPGLVAALDIGSAREYLLNINGMWGSDYRIETFTPVYIRERKERLYFFLVAGHRRFRAVKMAGRETFYARLHFQSSFSEALTMQYHENIHEQVPPDDEARFITLLWRREMEMAKGKRFVLTSFARALGKTPDAIRRSIRFTALPVCVQNLVLPSKEFKKGIAYALLCELARLQEARIEAEKPFTEAELMQISYILISQYGTAKKASAWVSEQIRVLNGQGEMFELSLGDAVDGAHHTVASGLERTVRLGHEHLRVVARIHEGSDVIRKVASDAAVMAVNRTIDLVCETAPKIIDGLSGARGSSDAKSRIRSLAGNAE